MNLLALDTATEACSVAVKTPQGIFAKQFIAPQQQSQRLPALVAEVLAEAGVSVPQLDGYIIGIGPGSFVGVRLAMGLLKGLHLAHPKPLRVVTSLQLLRAASPHANTVAAIDARMGEVYVQIGDQPPKVCPPDHVQISGDWHGVGTGIALLQGLPWLSSQPQALPDIRHAFDLYASLPEVSAAEVAPLYLRNNVALTLKEQKQRAANAL